MLSDLIDGQPLEDGDTDVPPSQPSTFDFELLKSNTCVCASGKFPWSKHVMSNHVKTMFT